jgi:hypothetical protein
MYLHFHVLMLELLIRGVLCGDVINIILCKCKNYGSMDSHYLNFFICPNYLVKLNSNKICLC